MSVNHKHGRTFEAWMDKVNAAIEGKCGLTSRDLADQPYRDWFDSKMQPTAAANKALKDEGFFDAF